MQDQEGEPGLSKLTQEHVTKQPLRSSVVWTSPVNTSLWLTTVPAILTSRKGHFRSFQSPVTPGRRRDERSGGLREGQ